MEKATKEYPIRDKNGKVMLTVKLIGGKSRIFIGEKEVMTCRFVPLQIPERGLPQFEEIESINDIIDHLDHSQEGLFEDYHGDGSKIASELDFFVNCSNLEAWVLHDYDTRLLDYRLSFSLLKKLAKTGDPLIRLRLKEEILKRYEYGTEAVRTYLLDLGSVDFLGGEERQDLFLEEDWKIFLSLEREIPESVVIRKNSVAKDSGLNEVALQDKQITGVKLRDFDSAPNKVPTCLRQLKNLEILILDRQGLDAIPEWLGEFKQLKFLELIHLEITKIPSSIGNLEKLEHLDLSRNQLTSLPDSIGNLTNLKELDLSNNRLEALPESFGKLENLEKLLLYSNRFESVPNSLRELKNLKYLQLNHNNLKSIPEWLDKLILLEDLDLRKNQLVEIPPSIKNLTHLKSISIGFNPIKEFPHFLLTLPEIEDICISQSGIPLTDELIELGEKKNIDIY